jgi:16S rRNA (uracil1498-N3)-methyltransferase
MPATPAWPPKSTPRLFVDEQLSLQMEVNVDGASAHYLLGVMRLKTGAPVKLFDDRSGEYLAHVTHTAKRDLTLTVAALVRPREETPDLWLCQALIKKDRLDWITEKSCELGISCFVPLLTSRCVADKVKEDRMRLQMIEAAEQCERTALPTIAPLTKLDALLKVWPNDRILFYCNERGGEHFEDTIGQHGGKSAILIGPEGGFTDSEIAALEAHPSAIAVSLGPRILRAETAAITAISIWMASSPLSDWRKP